MKLHCTPLKDIFYVVKAKHPLPFLLDDQLIPIFVSGNILAWYSCSLTLYVHLNMVVSFLATLIAFFYLTNHDAFPKA